MHMHEKQEWYNRQIRKAVIWYLKEILKDLHHRGILLCLNVQK